MKIEYIVEKAKKHLDKIREGMDREGVKKGREDGLRKKSSLVGKMSVIAEIKDESADGGNDNRLGHEGNGKKAINKSLAKKKTKGKNNEKSKTNEIKKIEDKQSEAVKQTEKTKSEFSTRIDLKKLEDYKQDDSSELENSTNAIENGQKLTKTLEKPQSPNTKPNKKSSSKSHEHSKTKTHQSDPTPLLASVNSIIPSSHTKLIKYTFSDISLEEFKNRLSSNENLIKEYLSTEIPYKDLISKLLSISRIVPKPEHILVFPREIHDLLSIDLSQSSHSKSPIKINRTAKNPSIFSDHLKCSYPIFIQACINWYNVVHFSKDLKSKLLVSIKEYEEIKNKMIQNEDMTFINSLIRTLKIQLKKVIETSLKFSRNLTLDDRGRYGAHEIFLYYSKQKHIKNDVETKPKTKKIEVLKMQIFIEFCEDFSILKARQGFEEGWILRDQAEELFMGNCDGKNDMHEYQFIQALEQLAVKYFDEEYDRSFKTNWKDLERGEKLLRLFEVLNFNEPSLYAKRMKNYKVKQDKAGTNKTSFSKREYSDNGFSGSHALSVSRGKSLFPLESNIPSVSQSKKTSLSPRIVHKPVYHHNTHPKGQTINNDFIKRPPPTFGPTEKPTKEELKNTKSEQDNDFMKFISKDSSEEDILKAKNQPFASSLSNSISHKILKRADELGKFSKKQEDDRLKQIFKYADDKAEKNMNFTRKYKK